MTTPSEWQYKAKTEWNDLENGQNQVVMNLDFDLQKILALQAANNGEYLPIGETLEENKTDVRKEIFRVADVEVLPEILKDGAEVSKVPVVPNNHADVETQANVKIDTDYQTQLKNEALGIRNKMKLVISMNSNMEGVSSVQALESVRHGVASAIENNITQSLESSFQGKSNMNVESSWVNEDTERVESYEVKEAA